jgi:DNA-binding response OmpR family regulator
MTERAAGGTRRVLIVDDERAITKVIGKRLEVAGYEVIVAADGEDGLSKARLGRPDAIILDLMMPKMNGMEVCVALKRDPQYQHIPVLIFTAKGQPMDEQLCRECGADAFLNKAAQASVIIEQVEALLGRLLR